MPAPLPAPETEVLPLTEGSEEATDMQHHGVTFFDEHFFDPFQDLDWSQTALEDIQIQVIQDDRSREVEPQARTEHRRWLLRKPSGENAVMELD